jgi:hypothetical protein
VAGDRSLRIVGRAGSALALVLVALSLELVDGIVIWVLVVDEVV